MTVISKTLAAFARGLTYDAIPETADQWFESATQKPGSWWDDWQAWMDKHNGGEKVAARQPIKPLEDAPGSYAMLRIGSGTAIKSGAPQDFK